MKLILPAFLLLLYSCIRDHRVPLIAKDPTSEAEMRNTLFAFVGEKISVDELPQESDSWDGKFRGRYKILQRVYGNYEKDTIEFVAYDHYGIPEFSESKTVLLFVSEKKGRYFHEKYQFFNVYPTQDGKWAGIYDPSSDISKPPKDLISFSKDVLLPLTIVINDSEVISKNYSPPYFEIIGDKAFPLYGYTIEELFAAKKNGDLKWRGLFGKGNENWADSTVDKEIILEPLPKRSK